MADLFLNVFDWEGEGGNGVWLLKKGDCETVRRFTILMLLSMGPEEREREC